MFTGGHTLLHVIKIEQPNNWMVFVLNKKQIHFDNWIQLDG